MEQLTEEEMMSRGKSILKMLPSNVRYRCHLGIWAFSYRVKDESEPQGYKTENIANQAVRLLAKADLPEAWETLGDFCSSIANYEWENRETGCYFNDHGAFDYLAYFAVRAYLLGDKEQRAINILDRFSQRHSITQTLEEGFATAGIEEPKNIYDGFDLPHLECYVSFRKRVIEINQENK